MALIKCPACQHDISDQAQACPNCGHPLTKPTTTTKGGGAAGCLIAIVVIAAVVGGVVFFNDKTEAPTFDANQPDTITRIISEANAHPAARFENGKLSLTYSIDPWLLTASTAKSVFLTQAKTFFKDAFSSPVVPSACVEGTATFHDIKGNESRGKAIQLCMSRGNALAVQWDRIDTDNLPQIADSSFIHPGFTK